MQKYQEKKSSSALRLYKYFGVCNDQLGSIKINYSRWATLSVEHIIGQYNKLFKQPHFEHT